MKRLFCVGVLLLVQVSSVVAAPRQAAESKQSLDDNRLLVEWNEFQQLIERKAIVVVDVRPEEAYSAGHIPGALSIPMAKVRTQKWIQREWPRPIVFYCACPGEVSSFAAAEIVAEKGLKARALVGGISRWTLEGGRLERGLKPGVPPDAAARAH